MINASSTIGIDDEGVAFAAAAHLRDLDHRRFAVISFAIEGRTDPRVWSLGGWPDTPYAVTGRRLSGYARALRDHVSLDHIPLVHPGGAMSGSVTP